MDTFLEDTQFCGIVLYHVFYLTVKIMSWILEDKGYFRGFKVQSKKHRTFPQSGAYNFSI